MIRPVMPKKAKKKAASAKKVAKNTPAKSKAAKAPKVKSKGRGQRYTPAQKAKVLDYVNEVQCQERPWRRRCCIT